MRGAREAPVLAAALAIGALVAGTFRPSAEVPRLEAVPGKNAGAGFVGSGACRACHASEHASWERTYHRTMTSEARLDGSVRAPLDGRPLVQDGATFALFEKDGRPWARLPEGERPLVLATGSHHYQVYWFEASSPRSLELFPFAYLLGEGTFAPRREVFLLPAGAKEPTVAWERGCIQCHATGGETRRVGDTVAPRSGELGIACEACHGPGALHAERKSHPIDRYVARASRDEHVPDKTIVNPRRLSPERSSEVCGRCHSLSLPKDEADWWRFGDVRAFRPGEPLANARLLLTKARIDDGRFGSLEDDVSSFFYDDGTLRVAGRELGDMTASACFVKGGPSRKVSCLSCHSMHRYQDPNDQLATADPNAPCRECHAREARSGEAHTRHRPGSSGGECLACHMPRTTYALLGGIRTHRIDRGRLDDAEAAGRPDACTLCHADRSRAWVAAELARGWGEALRPRGASATDDGVPRAIEAFLRGDAATRALYADAFGRPETHAASRNLAQIARVLAHAESDPIAAVRRIATRSRATLPLLDPSLPPDLARLASQRDDRPITLSE